MTDPKQPKNPTGPAPQRLKIDATFEQAAKTVLGKPKPPAGWPDRPPAKGAKKPKGKR